MTENTRVELFEDELCSKLNFFNPKANSLTSQMLTEMAEAVKSASSPLLHITSQGEGAFCAGASFSQMQNAKSLEEATKLFSDFANLLSAIIRSGSLVICSVQGATVGGGVGLVAACDYAFGASESRFKLSELDVGLTPAVIFPLLKAKMGATQASYMAIDRLWRDPEWAVQHGLLTQIATENQVEKFISGFSEIKPQALENIINLTRKDIRPLLKDIVAGASSSGNLAFSGKNTQVVRP